MATWASPVVLFPWLALAFALAALWAGLRTPRLRGSAMTWGLLALIFGGVSIWLHSTAAPG